MRSWYSPFLTPSICLADLLLVSVAICVVTSSSWYFQFHPPLLCFATSGLSLISSLLRVGSSHSAFLFQCFQSFASESSPFSSPFSHADSSTLYLSFSECFSTETSHCPHTEPVPSRRVGTLALVILSQWQLDSLNTREVCLHQHLHERSANPDGDVTKLECPFTI